MLKILFIVEQCNPEWPSVPLVAYNLWDELVQIADVQLVTHERNRPALEQKPWCATFGSNSECAIHRKIDYIEEPALIKNYYSLISFIVGQAETNWPLYHALTYPIYSSFNHQVYKKYADRVRKGDFDIVHAFTPVLPRYPVSLARVFAELNTKKAKLNTQNCNPYFILGPVNGGLPFPSAFRDIKKKEGGRFNFLRKCIHFIPNYNNTYLNASLIYAGSKYTQYLLKQNFPKAKGNIKLFHENGLEKDFFHAGYKGYALIKKREQYKTFVEKLSKGNVTLRKKPLRLLFVGRLVSYKGAHLVLEALAAFHAKKNSKSESQKVTLQYISSATYCKKHNLQNSEHARLTIVGEGPEHNALKKQAETLGIEHCVDFVGYKKPNEVLRYYKNADIFVFPSIREFGGAVVLEAMASGLVCIVVNYGGIGEYVDDFCGIKIDPLSSEYIIQKIVDALELLDCERLKMQQYRVNSINKAKKYLWSEKARHIVLDYANLVETNTTC